MSDEPLKSAALAALHTEDAWLLPPDGEMIQGREKIDALWTNRLAQIAEVKLTTVDIVPLGDVAAREVGRSVILTTSHLAEEIAGKYIIVWKKVDGVWKLEAEMWNSNTSTAARAEVETELSGPTLISPLPIRLSRRTGSNVSYR